MKGTFLMSASPAVLLTFCFLVLIIHRTCSEYREETNQFCIWPASSRHKKQREMTRTNTPLLTPRRRVLLEKLTGFCS